MVSQLTGAHRWSDRLGWRPFRGVFRTGGLAWLLVCLIAPVTLVADQPRTIRFATFNVSLYRDAPDGLKHDLSTGEDRQARRIAEVIQRVQPDVLLINEFDYDATEAAVEDFRRNYLEVSQAGQSPIRFPYHFVGPVNTGVPSGLDLDGDGSPTGPGDALGFGRFPGQYGMVVYSKLPIAQSKVRTFRKFLWRDLPDAQFPIDPRTAQHFYSAAARDVLRLPSKSMWDVPIACGDLGTIHFVVAHPTPPVFDGPEDRNGWRNHDEIRLLASYLDPARSQFVVDDRGRRGGLGEDERFVVAGDMNADPLDGDSRDAAIRQLLDHGRMASGPIPASRGAVAKSQADGGANAAHRGDPAHDTTDFANDRRVGNLRLDYVLASVGLVVKKSGVFWPAPGEDGHTAVAASDHRLVWIDASRSNDAAGQER